MAALVPMPLNYSTSTKERSPLNYSISTKERSPLTTASTTIF
ncbi:MAG: hypothetical protein ACFE0J_25110 [Elainellaceae cyanobacterium]